MIRTLRRVGIRHYTKSPPIPNPLDAPPIDLSKTFGTVESFSIRSMENVLHILEDAESRPGTRKRQSPFFEALKRLDTQYLNHFTNQFGRQLFTYAVLYHFNLRPFLASNPYLVTEFPAVLGQLQTRVQSPRPNSFFARNPELTLDHKLNYAQSIVRYFLMNDVHCLRRLAVDVQRVCKDVVSYDNSIRSYGLRLSRGIPSSTPYISHDPMELRSLLGTAKLEKNMLVFMPKHPDAIAKLTSCDPQLILAMMRCDEMEGEIAFEILCKRILLKIQEVKTMGDDVPAEKQYWQDGLLGDSGDGGLQFEYASNHHHNRRKLDIKQAVVRDLTKATKSLRTTSTVERVPQQEVAVDYAELNDRLLLDKMVEDHRSVRDLKVVVAHRSKIAGRMMYDPVYREAMAVAAAANDAETIKDVLVSYFDRYFGKFYGIDPVRAEKWMVNLLLAWDAMPLVTPAAVNEAVAGHRQMVAQCELGSYGALHEQAGVA
ncbi:uncharacterized protein CANTADRAFT_249950 [Suhomyces tanzawaensis NRRL Y-17324]|uniref:Uncharacterized protein n=1 Tax=Suhomyces tanzawaensis NRRL Y-17324 TaxID=984487 RepID=A0A1E4SID0_9ASCO|nr:uncharacterized protein CANTADRAFT_249950 [Suhomyces tanzawaensis NRRL Y-17324]ODV79197.1 hypothetical protein CANTADRAFT_249950 [Suhomyces tanzawaensis NRRL Y-17324]